MDFIVGTGKEMHVRKEKIRKEEYKQRRTGKENHIKNAKYNF